MKAFLLCVLALTLGLGSIQGQERFETLEIGPMVYKNVEVLSKTDTDLFIRHSRGSCNLKVAELPNDLRATLGYEVLQDRTPAALKTVEMDPRVQEMNIKMTEEIDGMLKTVAPGILFGVLGVALLLYLFICYCCKLICEKAGSPPSILIWIPFLQWFPLFRAAGMSGWAVITMFAPQVFMAVASLKLPSDLSPGSTTTIIFLGIALFSLLLPVITMIVWSVKICKARGKSGLLALFLILPMTNIFAFLYLAFSGTEDEEEGNPGFVTFS